MATRVYLRINLPNNTFGIDQERVSSSHDGLAELSQGAVCRCDPVVRVGEQPEGKTLLCAELLVRFETVHADSHDNCIPFVVHRQVALEIVGLNRTPGGHVFGIKVKYYPLITKVGKDHFRSFLGVQREAWCRSSDCWQAIGRE